MTSASNNTQDKKTDNLQDETDKLLSDKYILAKEIRDLIKTIKDSKSILNSLYSEIRDKLELTDQLEKSINHIDEIQNESVLSTTKRSVLLKLIKKINSEQDITKLSETLPIDEKDIIRGKQLLTDKILTLNNEIKDLQGKTECINLADADAVAESDHMKAQLKEIEEELSGQKYKEEQGIL
jgi:hypothetical protein